MNPKLTIAIGSDHVGYSLKKLIAIRLAEKGIEVIDVGNHGNEDALFAPNAKKVADLVSKNTDTLGILICGTGQGMAMAANRVKGVRAAIAYDVLPAVLSKEHNNSNILCTGAWMIDEQTAYSMIDAWLLVSYNGLYNEGLALLETYRNE